MEQDYKKAILSYQKDRLAASAKDPNHLTRQLAGTLSTHIIDRLQNNPEFYAQNPDQKKALEDQATYGFGVSSGSITTEGFDPVHFGQILDAHDGPGGSPGAKGSGGWPTPANAAPPGRPGIGWPTPATPGAGPAGPAPPPEAPIGPNQYALLNVAQRMQGQRPLGMGAPGPGGAVMPRPGIAPGVSGFAPPPAMPADVAPPAAAAPPPVAPAAAAPEPAPEAAFDPVAELRGLLQHPPKSTPNKLEMPKDFQARARRERADWKAQVDALKEYPQVQNAITKGTLLGQQVTQGPDEFKSKQEQRSASAAQSREAVRASQVLTPVKKKVGEATATAIPKRVEQGAQHVTIAGRQATVAERNATTNEGRLAEQRNYHNQLADRSRAALQQKATSPQEKADHELIASGNRQLTATHGVGNSLNLPFDSPERKAVEAKVEAAVKRVEKRANAAPTPAAAAPASAPAAKSGSPKATVPAAPKGQPAITQGEKDHVQAALKAGPKAYNDWLNGMPAKMRERTKYIASQAKR